MVSLDSRIHSHHILVFFLTRTQNKGLVKNEREISQDVSGVSKIQINVLFNLPSCLFSQKKVC